MLLQQSFVIEICILLVCYSILTPLNFKTLIIITYDLLSCLLNVGLLFVLLA